MGIVVSIAMLFGLTVLRPTPWRSRGVDPKLGSTAVKLAIGLLVLLGVWNIVWYGFRNLSDLWGVIAITSGAVMLSAARIIYIEHLVGAKSQVDINVRSATIILLAGFFLLYVVSIVQLNLGLPILGRP